MHHAMARTTRSLETPIASRSDTALLVVGWTTVLLALALYLRSAPAGFILACCGMGLLVTRHLRRTCRLDRRNRALERDVRHLKAVEGLAEIGRWCIEWPERRHLWSQEMCQIAGLPTDAAPNAELLARLMPDGMGQLEVTLAAHATDREPYAAEFELLRPDGEARILRSRARNVYSPKGRLERVLMVVRDATEDYAFVQQVEEEKARALRLAEEARREADTDALTGLASRRAIMAALDRSILGAERSGKPCSIVMFDIDHFKEVNDQNGHAVGDKVLVRVAQIALRHARDGDLVGRIGGEEFLWLLSDCDEREAVDAAERLRWAVEAGTHSQPVPDVTTSAGHATHEMGEGALSLFARADAALYGAKRAGRNQVARAA